MTDEPSLLPAIQDFVRRFESQAFSSDAERYTVFLLRENERLREILAAYERKLIEKMQELGDCRRKLRS